MTRMLLRLCALLIILGHAARVGAQDVTVPVSLQMELLLKVASYDKNLKERARDRVRVAVVSKQDDADSARYAGQALKALSEVDDVSGMPVEPISLIYTDAAALARFTREGSVAVLYVAPGFGEAEMDAIALALDGINVLSAGALSKYTIRGLVLGFELAGGKPKLWVHLERARRQRVELSSSVLKLMRVIE
jgi:nanoRNase/pAp phosphatase (c-di-AMP/oligoRNAs hydrolase)